jgi:hypothetical protein
MSYKRFKLPEENLADLATVAGVHAQTSFLPRPRIQHTVKSKLVSYNNEISIGYELKEENSSRRPKKLELPCAAATVAKSAKQLLTEVEFVEAKFQAELKLLKAENAAVYARPTPWKRK